MQELDTIFSYLKEFANDLGERIVDAFPPLYGTDESPSPLLKKLLRQPLPAQVLAVMGMARHLQTADSTKLVAECGTGKTLMSVATCYVHAAGKPFTSLVMCPPHLTKKWAREVFQTVPSVRVFFIEDMRNAGDPKKPHGVVEVILRNGKIERKGLGVSLTRLRQMGRAGWKSFCPETCFFILSKEKGKLSYFWRHAFSTAVSGPHLGSVIGIDSGRPVEDSAGGHLSKDSFQLAKKSEVIRRSHGGTAMHSALWQADKAKIQRVAPLEYMGRYMRRFFDYSIADELHQLAGDTAQGNGLAVLARVARKTIGMTGTLTGGYADDVYNILYRMDAPRMARDGYVWGGEGRKLFQSTYGVQEEVVKRLVTDNSCSKASKPSVTIKRKPGCSPVLFGRYLMESTAFVSLEDISAHLPSYTETVLPVAMDDELSKEYTAVEDAIKDALKRYPRNSSLTSIMLNTLLCYPDHPFGYSTLIAKVKDKQTGLMFPVEVCEPASLDYGVLREKERSLLEDVKAELAEGRRVQVFATFTGEHDVAARLRWVFEQEHLRVAVLRSSVPTEAREAWYAARLAEGVQVVICHPRLVETGLDLLDFPTIYFYETGYSLHTLRQASRRSWRIGQKWDVRIKFLLYSGTMQEKQVSLMGRKMLVALMLEGKMSGEGLDGYEEDDDMMTSLVRELLDEGRVGESADAVWKSLERERGAHVSMPVAVHTIEQDATSQDLFNLFTSTPSNLLPFHSAAPTLTPDHSSTVNDDPAILTGFMSQVVPSPAPPTMAQVIDIAVAAATARKNRSRSSQSAVDAGQMMLFG